MPSPLLTNEAGLFNGVRWRGVLDNRRLAMLNTVYQSRRQDYQRDVSAGRLRGAEVRSQGKQFDDMARALHLLAQLPVIHLDDVLDRWSPRSRLSLNFRVVSKEIRVLPVLFNERFLVSSAHCQVPDDQSFGPDPTTWHLGTAKALFAVRGSLATLAYWGALNEHQDVDLISIKQSAQLARLLGQGKVRLSDPDPVQHLGEATGWAVYFHGNGHHPGGYLNRQGNFTPSIAGAQLFESAKAAQLALRHRGAEDFSVVSLALQLTGVAPGQAEHKGALGAAISEVRRKALHRALDEADVETLRERVATLEARLGESDGTADGPTQEKRPRM